MDLQDLNVMGSYKNDHLMEKLLVKFCVPATDSLVLSAEERQVRDFHVENYEGH